jgi:rare lipoprotein A
MKTLCILVCVAVACGQLHGATLSGKASYYHDRYEGRMCANNKTVFHQESYYAAHRTLPFGTRVKVTNLHNKKSVVVTIVDRGPSKKYKARIIDLSKKAARELDMLTDGVVPVSVEVCK